MTKFEIVDGVVRGYATAVVELSYEIPVYELRESYKGEAETAEEFLDLIRDDIHNDIERYIEISLDDLGYRCDDGVNLDSSQTPDINEMELDVEVEEVEDDEV
jgi:septum formation topological specificity factor MinE